MKIVWINGENRKGTTHHIAHTFRCRFSPYFCRSGKLVVYWYGVNFKKPVLWHSA